MYQLNYYLLKKFDSLYFHFIDSISLLFLKHPIVPFRELITCYNVSLVTFYILSLTTNITINKTITDMYMHL